ncbi:MAG: sulfotransferase [Pirellulales bacterium]
MRLRDACFRRFGPNNFGGTTLGTWLQILCDNRFSIDAPYWPRAAMITLFAAFNSVPALIERLQYGKKIADSVAEPPIFVLGAWRSGTTHLHNLLSLDTRFAYPAQFDVSCPSTCINSEGLGTRIFDWVVPKQRPQDAVKMGAREAQEEDFAICALSGQTNLLAWAFPRNAAFYMRYMTLTGLSAVELKYWTDTYTHFLKKLTYKYRRPLVLKTPANTGRIRTLLELFPDAKFVTIHRHPYDVFLSLTHTLRTAGPWWQLQKRDYNDGKAIANELVEQLRSLFNSYFAQRSLIPPSNLCEVAFADLERDPVGQLRKIYDALQLPTFETVEPSISSYMNALSNYKKNEFGPLSPELKLRLQQEWSQCFAEWGYAV